MAKQAILNIKNWFKTGLKPTQDQFWDWIDSYWHKDEQIPIAKIDGVQPIYDAINNHINDANAHTAILVKSRIYPFGSLQIFKSSTNIGSVLEAGDIAVGFLNDGVTFIPFGQYLGTDPQDINNWNTSAMDFS
jgi:hypothetical protein